MAISVANMRLLLTAACFTFLLLMPAASNSTAAVTIENHPGTEEWWVAFYVRGVDALDCNLQITAIEITDRADNSGQWVSNNPDFSYQWSFNNPNAAFTPPLSLRITATSNDTAAINETYYACDVITTLEPAQAFPLDIDLCDTAAGSDAIESCSTSVDVTEDTHVDVQIKNHHDTELYWVALYVENVELLPCDILLADVEITDNTYYKQRWIPNDEESSDQWAFLNIDAPYTLPLSLRLTTLSANGVYAVYHTFYACNAITSFEALKLFNLTIDLCNTSLADVQSENQCWDSDIVIVMNETRTTDEAKTTQETQTRHSDIVVIVAVTVGSACVVVFLIYLYVHFYRQKFSKLRPVSEAHPDDDHGMESIELQPGRGHDDDDDEDIPRTLPKTHTVTNYSEGFTPGNIGVRVASLNVEGLEQQNITAHAGTDDDEPALPFSPSGSSDMFPQAQTSEAQLARSPSASSGMYAPAQPNDTAGNNQELEEIVAIHVAPSQSGGDN